jgi:HSP20 family protein
MNIKRFCSDVRKVFISVSNFQPQEVIQMKYEIWDPFEDMKKLRKQMDKLFSDFWSEKITMPKGMRLREPLVDIVDRKNAVEVRAELPGIDRKNVKINVEEDRVEIKAEKKEEKEEKKKDFYRQERAYRGFYKSFTLPAKIDSQKAKAKFDKGILTLTLPKLKQVPGKKTILLK